MDAIDTIGCFQLINHGVPEAKVRAAADKTIFQDETEEFVLYKDVADACNSDLRYGKKVQSQIISKLVQK